MSTRQEPLEQPSRRRPWWLLGFVVLGLVTGLLGERLLARRHHGSADASEPPNTLAARAPAARPTAAPRFISNAGTTVVTDPADPSYDPIRIMDELKQRLQTVYKVEPRDEAWATAMETGMRPGLTRDLDGTVPGTTDLIIDCRTTTCRFNWHAPDGQDRRVRHIIRTLYGGAAMGIGRENEVYVAYSGGRFFTDTKGHSATMLARLAADRSRRLPYLRDGKGNEHDYSAIPSTEWPAN
jgi:hypothetical protein